MNSVKTFKKWFLSSIRVRYYIATIILFFLAIVLFYIGSALIFSYAIKETESRVTSRMISDSNREEIENKIAKIRNQALWNLGIFSTLGVVVFLLPIFWLYKNWMLNPIAKMARAILKLATPSTGANDFRLDCKGKDEFAFLASAINRMIEISSARTVAIAQLEASQRAIVAGMPDALLLFDNNGVLVSVYKDLEDNVAIPGLNIGETLSSEVYREEEIALFKMELDIAFRFGEITNIRLMTRGDHRVASRHFELRLSRKDDKFILGIMRDVTPEVIEQKLHTASLHREMESQKQKSLTLFAAGIAHDVNNVLTVILNTIQTSQVTDDCRDAVVESVKRGSAMTRELMTFAGTSKIILSRVSASMVIKDVQKLLFGIIGNKIEITYRLAENLPDVDVDKDQIWKVFFNFVKNASEAIGDRIGHIEISTEEFQMSSDDISSFVSERQLKPGRGVLFSVADDGPGIPAEFKRRLFDPYVSSKSSGRGLGLSIVRAIVDAHEGGIQVASAKDHGTVFSVFLPESHLEEVTRDVAISTNEEHLIKNVLIVDNEDAILRTSSILLKTLGVDTFLAHNKQEALAIMRRHSDKIDAVILDANLDNESSVNLLLAIREISNNIRVIITSGSNEVVIRDKFQNVNFDFFLAKPWTLSEIKSVLG